MITGLLCYLEIPDGPKFRDKLKNITQSLRGASISGHKVVFCDMTSDGKTLLHNNHWRLFDIILLVDGEVDTNIMGKYKVGNAILHVTGFVLEYPTIEIGELEKI